MKEKQQKIIQAFDSGDITESEARDLLGRVQAGGGAVYRKERAVIDEVHPDLSAKDRFNFKNWSTKSEDAQANLQSLYPEHKLKRDANGYMLMRRPDEEDWMKIDKTAMDPKEFIQDVGDVAFDVPAALFETGATIAGGTAGLAGGPAAPVTVPAGAVAAGAGAGATTEAVRQTIGKMTGFTKEYDTGQIGTSAAFGAASPLLFGSGATAKSVLKGMMKKGLPKGMTMEAAEKTAAKVAQAQRSVLTRGVGKMVNATTPKLASWASGYTSDTLKKLRERMASGLMSVNPAEVPKAFRADVMGAFGKKKAMLQETYGKALESLDVAIDTQKLEQPFFDLLKTYKTRAAKAVPGYEKLLAAGKDVPNADVQDLLYLQKSIEPYLQKGRVLEGADIVNYLDKMKDLSKLRKSVNVQGMTKVDQELIRVTKQIGGSVDDGLDATLAGKEFKNIKAQYAEIFDDADLIKKYLKDDKAAESSLRNLQSNADFTRKDALERISKNYGVDITNYQNDMYLLSQFLNPKATGQYLGGTSPMLRSVPLALGAGAVGYGVGQQTGMSPYLSAAMAGALGSRAGSAAAIKRYTQMGGGVRKGLEVFRNTTGANPQRAIGIYQQLNQRED